MGFLLGCSLSRGESTIDPTDEPRPAETHAHFVAGVDHAAAGRFAQAITAFDRVLRIDPGDAYAYVGRGHAHLNLERYGEATADFENALGLLPKEAHALVLLNIGVAQLHGGHVAAAIDTFDRIIASRPEGHWNVYVYRGLAQHELGRYRAAISDYGKYIGRNPDEGYPYYLRGVAKHELGCFDAALADIDQANLLLPQIAEIVNMREQVVYARLLADSVPSVCRNL